MSNLQKYSFGIPDFGKNVLNYIKISNVLINNNLFEL